MELSVREAGRRGGTRTKELYGPEFYRRLGGTTLRDRRGREYYAEIGREGGRTVLTRYGREFFSRIGRLRKSPAVGVRTHTDGCV
jgi:general stress protein YciG